MSDGRGKSDALKRPLMYADWLSSGSVVPKLGLSGRSLLTPSPL